MIICLNVISKLHQKGAQAVMFLCCFLNFFVVIMHQKVQKQYHSDYCFAAVGFSSLLQPSQKRKLKKRGRKKKSRLAMIIRMFKKLRGKLLPEKELHRLKIQIDGPSRQMKEWIQMEECFSSLRLPINCVTALSDVEQRQYYTILYY